MATETKKTKAEPAPKAEAAAAPKAEATKDKSSSGEGGSKTDSGEKASVAPANYSRGEGQKPVTAAYKDNWNAIFAKKKPKKSKR
jgi:hypothetical protein